MGRNLPIGHRWYSQKYGLSVPEERGRYEPHEKVIKLLDDDILQRQKYLDSECHYGYYDVLREAEKRGY